MINLFFRTSDSHVHSISGNDSPIIYSTVLDLEPYVMVDALFKFAIGDLIIVLSAGSAIDVRNIATISSATSMLVNASNQSVERVFIFTEDLYTFKEDTAEEIIFLRQLVDYMKYTKYQIYHCEQKLHTLNTLGLDIKYFDWFVISTVNYYTNVLDPVKVSERFDYKICCLNRRFGEHRYLASAVLSNYPQAYYTQQYSLEDTRMYYLDTSKFDNRMKTLVDQGFTNLKKRTILNDRATPVEQIDLFEYSSDTAVYDLNLKTRNAFCSLITESRFHSQLPNFSEKTIRVLYSGRPFLLLAPPGTLKLLQDLGIKTFSQFWDESYDSIQDHTLRFQRVMQLALDIQSTENLSIEPFIDILEHNQRQLDHIPRLMYDLQFV